MAELLDRHGLSLGEAEFQAQPCAGLAVPTGRRRLGALDECVPAVADFFGCRVWVEQAPGQTLRYIFFGLHGDVAAAHYLYDMVQRAFETETDAFRGGALYADMAGERRSATNSFQLGLAKGICRKLRALQATRSAHLRSASGRDLVMVKAGMVDEEVAKLGLSLHTRRTPGGKRVLSDAYDAGEEAGARFEVTPGLSHAA